MPGKVSVQKTCSYTGLDAKQTYQAATVEFDARTLAYEGSLGAGG